jgi:hypothetical protein
MHDGITYLSLVVGFGFVLIAGAKLGAGSQTFLAGLFPVHGARDWPTGVQESDAPRFAVEHLDQLRPERLPPIDTFCGLPLDDTGDPRPEIIELGVRRLDTPRA